MTYRTEKIRRTATDKKRTSASRKATIERKCARQFKTAIRQEA